VTSNVKDYVNTLKEETEALSTIVQEELDDVADSISRNLPFVVGLKKESVQEKLASAQSPIEGNQSKDEIFADADPSKRVESASNEETERQMQELKEEQEQWEDDNKLRHDPLFPPGRILYLNRVIAPGPPPPSPSGGGETKSERKVPDVVEFVEVATDEFGRVVLSNRMLLDHLCTDYERVLQAQAKALPNSTWNSF
jgi:hypothetical protein